VEEMSIEEVTIEPQYIYQNSCVEVDVANASRYPGGVERF
jgi:hypothetical protein